MTNETESDEQFTQLIGGGVEMRCTIGKGLVQLQMALSAMSLADDIEDIKHVKDNPAGLFVLENTLRGPINRLGFLNLDLLDVVVSMVVFLTKTPNRGCVLVIWMGVCKNGIIAPVPEDVDDVVVLLDSLHRLECLQMLGEKRLISDDRSIEVDAKCGSKKQLAMLCYHCGVSTSHLRSIGRGSGGKNVIFSNGPNSTSECSKLLY